MIENPLIRVPFTILIDSQEQQPFWFDRIAADRTEYPANVRRLVDAGQAEPADVLLSVPIVWQSLGASRGDYSIEGFEGRAHIERKSMDDAHGTILAYGDRRDRFERELEFLASIECGAVVVECSMDELLAAAPEWGKKTAAQNRKQLFRQIHAWQMDYRVPWFFYGSRAMAEIGTFRLLQRFWKSQQKKEKAATKQRELIDSL